jgi:membrane-associated phospholipid phosphatase
VLCSHLRVFSRKGYFLKVLCLVLPFLAASGVAFTRVSDYRHHWEDGRARLTAVAVGALLGSLAAFFAFRQYFPPLAAEGAAEADDWRTLLLSERDGPMERLDVPMDGNAEGSDEKV